MTPSINLEFYLVLRKHEIWFLEQASLPKLLKKIIQPEVKLCRLSHYFFHSIQYKKLTTMHRVSASRDLEQRESSSAFSNSILGSLSCTSTSCTSVYYNFVAISHTFKPFLRSQRPPWKALPKRGFPGRGCIVTKPGIAVLHKNVFKSETQNIAFTLSRMSHSHLTFGFLDVNYKKSDKPTLTYSSKTPF